MSSQDSIKMVLKCMLRGAADYLIKPMRKNELKNLWQHVWRRLTVSYFPFFWCSEFCFLVLKFERLNNCGFGYESVA